MKVKRVIFNVFCLFVCCLFVSGPVFSSEHFQVEFTNNHGGGFVEEPMTFYSTDYCGGKALIFSESVAKNVRDYSTHLWSDDTLMMLTIIALEGRYYPVEITDNNLVRVCVGDSLRAAVAFQLGKDEIENALSPDGVDVPFLIEYAASTLSYLTAASIGVAVSEAAALSGGAGLVVGGIVMSYLPAADDYIEEHLYLWSSGDPLPERPGTKIDYGYIPYQVKLELIDTTIDYMCKGSATYFDYRVERYRDIRTGRLVAQRAFPDGLVWVYGPDRKPISYPWADAVDFSNPGNVHLVFPVLEGLDSPVLIATYPDNTYVDPVTNHKHAIGMHSVRGRLQGHDTWKYEISVEEGTSLHLNMRVKVKEKEDRDWEDVYVDLYYSPNRWFSRSHDTLIKTLKISTLDAEEKESRYFDDINISNLEPGNHYYFADIRYGGEHNISSRKDDTEYLRLTVVAQPEEIVLPDYTYNKTETCGSLTYDELDWTFTRYDVKSVFNLGETIHAITEINNVRVNHKLKMEVYHNGEYWWTEEDPAFRQVSDYWGQSYKWVGQSAEEVGIFTFKTYIDLGNGWEVLCETFAIVEDPNAPTDPFIFNGVQTAANVTYDEATWSHHVGTPKSIFSLNEEIWVLAELTDITVSHRLKIEVWVNGYHWWTEGEDSSFTEVNGTLDRTYLHLSQGAEETGTFTFKTFIDIGNGWQSLGEVSATVQ